MAAAILQQTTKDPPGLIAPVCAGILVGLLLSPDMDQAEIHFVVPMQAFQFLFGSLLGTLWGLYWWPYGRLIAHRSWISHMPIVGTTLRLVYLAPVWFPIWLMLGSPKPEWLILCFSGLCVSDALHWLLDVVV